MLFGKNRLLEALDSSDGSKRSGWDYMVPQEQSAADEAELRELIEKYPEAFDSVKEHLISQMAHALFDDEELTPEQEAELERYGGRAEIERLARVENANECAHYFWDIIEHSGEEGAIFTRRELAAIEYWAEVDNQSVEEYLRTQRERLKANREHVANDAHDQLVESGVYDKNRLSYIDHLATESFEDHEIIKDGKRVSYLKTRRKLIPCLAGTREKRPTGVEYDLALQYLTDDGKRSIAELEEQERERAKGVFEPTKEELEESEAFAKKMLEKIDSNEVEEALAVTRTVRELAEKIFKLFRSSLGIEERFARDILIEGDETIPSDSTSLGSYASTSHEIWIDLSAISGSRGADIDATVARTCATIAHELLHAYQEQISNSTDEQYDDLAHAYIINDKGYRYSRKGYDGYRQQLMEREAFAFGALVEGLVAEIIRQWREPAE